MKSLNILSITIIIVSCNIGLTIYDQNFVEHWSNSMMDRLIEPEIKKAWAEKIETPRVFIQIKLYDANGQFIGYNEGIPQIFYLDKVIEWVEPRSQKSTIKINGEIFEILQFVDHMVWSEDQSHGQYYLQLPVNGQLKTILFFHQDSFHVKEGDRAYIFWTVFRPMN